MNSLNKDELFTPEFLQSLSSLRIIANRVARGGRYAEQRSVDMGSGTDFRDFRSYSPGDDFRSIDWNIYQRLGRVVLKLYEELEDLPLYLLVDTSKSLFLETPPRAIAGLRSALALAAISLNHHDSVGIYPFSNDLTTLVPPQSGKGRILFMADRLAQVQAGGTTDIATSIKRFESYGLRQGLVAIVSDFFDPNGVDAVTESLKNSRHRLLLVQLSKKTDRDPDVQGELQLVDCESGSTEDVSVTDSVKTKYREAYDKFQNQLIGFVQTRRAGWLSIDVEQEVVPQLASIFERGVYTV